MFLSCDIGNTDTVFGVYNNSDGNYNDEEKDIFRVYRILTSEICSERDIFSTLNRLFFNDGISISDIEYICVSSVVPSQNKFYKLFCSLLNCRAIFISSVSKTGINLIVENPEKLGADRIVNASYAYHLSKEFQIIVDIGTALKIDIVDAAGNFKGGIIFPGLKTLAVCLNEKTALLPPININELSRNKNSGNVLNSDNKDVNNGFSENYNDSGNEGNETDINSNDTIQLIGDNTIKAIQSGLLYGTIFLIEGFIKEIQKQYNKTECKVIFTGGLSNIIADKCRMKGLKIIDGLWTIKGLKFLYKLNTAV
ncbi:MAG: type III pantothenate kinase [Candidatus Acididesulfobacter guangdongensis]|uniref:Type III pantothenate kinase n=1 Tax=Acididesulfobacter guangdongensis TaxID=2597225 RepID=A0A519BGF9_ACIG2|nr:MAG: type III pantothenate kinase [Candidatus Acididesulfobacter guangdongensis]